MTLIFNLTSLILQTVSVTCILCVHMNEYPRYTLLAKFFWVANSRRLIFGHFMSNFEHFAATWLKYICLNETGLTLKQQLWKWQIHCTPQGTWKKIYYQANKYRKPSNLDALKFQTSENLTIIFGHGPKFFASTGNVFLQSLWVHRDGFCPELYINIQFFNTTASVNLYLDHIQDESPCSWGALLFQDRTLLPA